MSCLALEQARRLFVPQKDLFMTQHMMPWHCSANCSVSVCFIRDIESAAEAACAPAIGMLKESAPAVPSTGVGCMDQQGSAPLCEGNVPTSTGLRLQGCTLCKKRGPHEA